MEEGRPEKGDSKAKGKKGGESDNGTIERERDE